MRKTFTRWLTLFMTLAFLVAVMVSFLAQTNMAAGNADELIGQRIVDMRLRIDSYMEDSAQARTIVDSQALTAARGAAAAIANDSTLLQSQERLQALADDLGVDELCVTDSAGIIIAAVPTENLHYDMASSEQSAAFLDALQFSNFKYVQPFQEKGLGTGDKVKYAGVARRDQTGLVQVGLYSSSIDETMTMVSEDSIAAGISVGDAGVVLVTTGSQIVSATDSEYVGTSTDDLGLDLASLRESSTSSVHTINGTDYRVQAETYKGYTVLAALLTSEVYLSRNNSLVGMTVLIALIFFTVFFLVSKLVQDLVIRGIFSVNGSLSKIAKGNLDEVVDVTTSPEFETLSNGINTTVDALKEHIAAEASRIDADLALAKAIQLGNLQTVFPAFPDHDEFDLYASMVPAREVGGDFYDMFMRDDTHLSCVIADVSGKGIPAAMFMMEAKSYINSLALASSSLADAFAQANDKLCANNDAGLFVTAFIMDLDITTGGYEFVNAGHNPPVICHVDGSCEYLKCRAAFVLGGMTGVKYRSGTGTLQPGERFVGYTDGVTEALDEKLELYGEQRLLNFLTGKMGQTARELVDGLQAELVRYRGTADQADDITVLVLDFVKPPAAAELPVEEQLDSGPQEASVVFGQRGKAQGASANLKSARLKVEADRGNWEQVSEFTEGFFEEQGCPQATVMQMTVALEEVFVNVASYAYSPEDVEQGKAYITIICEANAVERAAAITVIDQGVEFNPLEHADPDIKLPAEERGVGGLGILMVRKMMDQVAYERENGANLFFMRKGWQ